MIPYLADTNVLLRLVSPQDPARPLAIAAVAELQHRGDEVFIAAQNPVEFWNAASRPTTSNGLGFPVSRIDQEVQGLGRSFRLLSDSPAVHLEWRRLVSTHLVVGRQVHDARLAAVMLVHGISHRLTFNVAEFARYPGITAVHPGSVRGTRAGRDLARGGDRTAARDQSCVWAISMALRRPRALLTVSSYSSEGTLS